MNEERQAGVGMTDEKQLDRLTQDPNVQILQSEWDLARRQKSERDRDLRTSSCSPLSETLTRAWGERELPEKPCPGCGEPMNHGILILGNQVYSHQVNCPAAIERNEECERGIRRERHIRVRRERSNIPFHGDAPDLTGYVAKYGRDRHTQNGIHLCEDFIEACRDGRRPRTGFALQGPYGGGKTSAVCAFARSLLSLGLDVRFECTPDLYNRMLQASRDDSLLDQLESLCRYHVVILDDLGREKPTPWWVDQVLFPLVDHRYRNGLPTVVTTNKTWDELEDKWAQAKNQGGEIADNAGALRSRLEHQSALVTFGAGNQRRPFWDFRR